MIKEKLNTDYVASHCFQRPTPHPHLPSLDKSDLRAKWAKTSTFHSANLIPSGWLTPSAASVTQQQQSEKKGVKWGQTISNQHAYSSTTCRLWGKRASSGELRDTCTLYVVITEWEKSALVQCRGEKWWCFLNRPRRWFPHGLYIWWQYRTNVFLGLVPTMPKSQIKSNAVFIPNWPSFWMIYSSSLQSRPNHLTLATILYLSSRPNTPTGLHKGTTANCHK